MQPFQKLELTFQGSGETGRFVRRQIGGKHLHRALGLCSAHRIAHMHRVFTRVLRLAVDDLQHALAMSVVVLDAPSNVQLFALLRPLHRLLGTLHQTGQLHALPGWEGAIAQVRGKREPIAGLQLPQLGARGAVPANVALGCRWWGILALLLLLLHQRLQRLVAERQLNGGGITTLNRRNTTAKIVF